MSNLLIFKKTNIYTLDNLVKGYKYKSSYAIHKNKITLWLMESWWTLYAERNSCDSNRVLTAQQINNGKRDLAWG